MTWQRVTALVLMTMVPAAGIWTTLACDGNPNDSDSDSAADYCTIICHAQGHYCPATGQQQDHSCTCNMAGSVPDMMIAGGVLPAVIQSPVQLDVTIEWTPATFASVTTPASAILEAPTPPPKILA